MDTVGKVSYILQKKKNKQLQKCLVLNINFESIYFNHHLQNSGVFDH